MLGVLVVAAAGIAGQITFSHPRWEPRWMAGDLVWATTQKYFDMPSTTKPPRWHHPPLFPVAEAVLWIIITIVVIGAATRLWRWWNQRPSREVTAWQPAVSTNEEIPIEPAPDPDVPTLRSGIERALQTLDEPREPADAIVRAWLGLQETAEESGIVRRAVETPTEFTSRILARAFVDDDAIQTLLRLYLRTRFSDHPVTSGDVAEARSALQALIRTWPAPASTARRATPR